MTEPNPYEPGQQPPPGWAGQPPAAPGYGQPAPYGALAPGSLGQVRGTGITMLLFFVTLGIYGWFYYFKVHEELKTHTGRGLGGPVALILAVVVGVANPFLLSDEVGKLYSSRGQEPPVKATTGLWVIPGFLTIVGPFIWFTKTNKALNDYWISLGVPAK